MVAKEFKEKGAKVNFVLDELGLSKASFYYKSKGGKKGRKPPGYSLRIDGVRVPDERIKLEIENLLLKEFVSYGYIKVTHYLKSLGYVINKKKVYRLMAEEKLLLRKRIKTRGKRDFVKMRVVKPKRPYEFLEMDIKYFWIEGEKKNAYLLTLLDTFSRKALSFKLKRSIKKRDVLILLKEAFFSLPSLKGITLRNDNGSQFLAYKVRSYLKEVGIYQEFTHVGSPEENSHIEAFHSILETEVVKRFEFETFEELEKTLDRYFKFYNEERIHSSIGYKSPERFLQELKEKEVFEGSEEKLLKGSDLLVRI
jgi:transposase InsO family protein